MFKLKHESEVTDGSSLTNAFRGPLTGGSGPRLQWGSGTLPVQNRVYVGYGEFTYNPNNPTEGTFSGIVDLPPLQSAGACPAYTEYCKMSPGAGGMDTPYRVCHTETRWGSSGSVPQTCDNWTPNTGVVECKPPLQSSFTSSYGDGLGNCVAHYAQRRSDNVGCSFSFSVTDFVYQVRTYNLQVKQAYDYTDGACAAVTN